MSPVILIVDDEQDLVATLAYNFEREGFSTRSAHTGEDALRLIQQEPTPDLVLLDLMLPDLPGTEVCRQLRQGDRTRHIPVVMLTAKSDEIDRVVGFELGADDYVAKPFSVRELLLRVRAILRRSNKPTEEQLPETFGVLTVDEPGHQVSVEGQPVRLTALEFKLLTTLLRRKGRVQSRETLLNDVWDIEADVTTRTVDTHVKRLREKLGSAGIYVETVRGVGYRFTANP